MPQRPLGNTSMLCNVLELEHLEKDARCATSSLRHARRHQQIPLIEERPIIMTTAANVERLPIADHGQVFAGEHLAVGDGS